MIPFNERYKIGLYFVDIPAELLRPRDRTNVNTQKQMQDHHMQNGTEMGECDNFKKTHTCRNTHTHTNTRQVAKMNTIDIYL